MTVVSNPILPGCHPDPTICRVGEDYYLVTSTFEYLPGLPVFRSRDLVDWEVVGHVIGVDRHTGNLGRHRDRRGHRVRRGVDDRDVPAGKIGRVHAGTCGIHGDANRPLADRQPLHR